MNKIESVGGLQVRTFSPPAGVRLADADERELAVYGLPFRPDPKHFPRAFRQWMRTASRPFQYVPARFSSNGRHRRGAGFHRPRIEESMQSASWAGSIVWPQPDDAFRWIAGIWTVPNVYPYGDLKDGTEFHMSAWVGIGGFGDQLLQAGTHQTVVTSGGTITRDCFLWYMVAPGFSLQMVGLDVAPGDQMNMVVCSTAPNSARFFALNETSGMATSWDIMPTDGINITGNSAEWIVEDPTVNDSLPPLPRFSEIFFEGTVAGTQNSEGEFTAAEGEIYVLADDLQKPLVTPAMDGDLLRMIQDL